MQIKLNPDKSLVDKFRQALRENGGYCPCAIDKTPDTLCMCLEFREKTEPGWCHCGLYKKVAG